MASNGRSRPVRIPVITELGDAIKRLRGVDRAVEETEESVDDLAQATKRSNAALRRLGVQSEASVERQKQALIEAYEAVRDSGVASASDVARAQQTLNRRLERLDRRLEIQKEQTVDLAAAWKRVVKAASNLRAALQRVRRAGALAVGALQRARAAAAGLARVGWSGFTAGVRTAIGVVQRLGRFARRAALTLTTAFAGVTAATTRLVQKTSADLSQVERDAQRAGLSLQQFQRFTFAGSTIGAEAEEISSTLQTLSERVVEFARLNQSTAREGFEALGIGRSDLFAGVDPIGPGGEVLERFRAPDGTLDTIKLLQEGGRFRTSAEVFEMMASSVSGMRDDALRTQVLFSLLGDDARFIVPLLEEGAGHIEKLAEEGRRVGAIASDAEIAQARQLEIRFRRLMETGRGLLRRIAVELFDDVRAALDRLQTLLEENANAIVRRVSEALRRVMRLSREALAFVVRIGELMAERLSASGGSGVFAWLDGIDGRQLADRLRPLVDFLVDTLQGALGLAGRAIRAFRDSWWKFELSFTTGRGTVVGGLASDLGVLASKAVELGRTKVSGALAALPGLLQSAAAQLPAVIDLTASLVRELHALFTGAPASTELGRQLKFIGEEIGRIFDPAVDAESALGRRLEFVGTLLDDLLSVLEKVRKLLDRVFGGVLDLFGLSVGEAGVLLALGKISGALGGIRKAVGLIVTRAIPALAAAFGIASNPAGWIVGAITAIGLLYGALKATDTWDDVIGFFTRTLPDAVGNAMTGIYDRVRGLFEWLGEMLGGLRQGAEDLVAGHGLADPGRLGVQRLNTANTAVAGGPAALALAPVTLNLAGGERVELSATKEQRDQLTQRRLRRAAVSSGGPKPSFY